MSADTTLYNKETTLATLLNPWLELGVRHRNLWASYTLEINRNRVRDRRSSWCGRKHVHGGGSKLAGVGDCSSTYKRW